MLFVLPFLLSSMSFLKCYSSIILNVAVVYNPQPLLLLFRILSRLILRVSYFHQRFKQKCFIDVDTTREVALLPCQETLRSNDKMLINCTP